MRKAGGPGLRRHVNDISPGIDLIMRGPFLGLPAVILLLIRVFRLLEVRFDDKARSVNKSEGYQQLFQNALDLVVGMISCHCRPGPPAFLVNVEKLGVARGRG